MSDKDFVVKNGLVVNTTFTANSTEVHIGNTSVNAVFTSPSTNTLTLTISNSSVTGTLTSANYSGTSANSTNLNSQPGSYYTNATNINAGTLPWAYQAANTVNTTGNFTIAGNLNFTAANNYFGNSTANTTIYINTINSTSNGVTVNNSLIVIGNSSVNVQINSTVISATANNALNLGGNLPSYYTNATNIVSGTLAWARAPINTVNTTGNFTIANLTINSSLTVTNGTVSTISNSSGLYALNGNVQTSYLETTSLANLAWANISGDVYVGGNMTVGGNLTFSGTTTFINSVSITTTDKNLVLANGAGTTAAANGSGIVVSTYANLVYSAASGAWLSNVSIMPAASSTQDIGSPTQTWNNLYACNLYGVLQSAQPGITVGDTAKLGGIGASNYVQNTDSRVLSGNLNFTGANTFFGSASVQGTAYFGNSTVTNTVINTAAVTLNGTGTTVGNVSVSYSGLITGNSTVTSNSVLWVQNTAGNTVIGANGAVIGGNTFKVGTTLNVTLGGNTGYGTSTPVAYVEIDNPLGTGTSNTLYLFQNNAVAASGTWDSYRYISTGSANTTAYQFRQFNVGPSGVGIGSVPPNSAKSLSDALYVFGNTGFNTTAPGALVDINGTLNVALGANIAQAISVYGDGSWSNGTVGQVFTATGSGTFAPYWSSNIAIGNVSTNILFANGATVNNNLSVGNNAYGTAFITIGNTTVYALANSTVFTGNAYNITQYPLNQSTNTSGNPSFNSIISNTYFRVGGSGTSPVIYFGSTATSTKNLVFTTSGAQDTWAFNSGIAAVLTVNNSTVVTSGNFGTYITFSNLSGKPTSLSGYTSDTFANSTNGFGINGIAYNATNLNGLPGSYYLNYNNLTGVPTFANATNFSPINGTAANSTLLNNQPGSYYLTYTNLTGRPTDLSSFTNGPGYVSSSSIPTRVSQLSNDSGYVTSGALGSYVTTSSLSSTLSSYATISSLSSYATTSSLTNGTLNLSVSSITAANFVVAGGQYPRLESVSQYKNVNFSSDTGISWNGSYLAFGVLYNTQRVQITVNRFNVLTNSGGTYPVREDGVTTWSTPSDRTLKKDISTITDAPSRIMALNPVNFTWKDTEKPDSGFIAQEFQEQYPNSVHDDGEGKLMIGIEMGFYADIVSTIQSLQNKINELETRLASHNM
jgi:hypothetical protein